MEKDPSDGRRESAGGALGSLRADRDRLAGHLRVPWTLMAAFGALGAWWVGAAATTTPGESYEPPQSRWVVLVGVLVVAHLVQRETGIRFRSMGAGATWSMIGVLVTCLALFSISLGLVSLDLAWAVVITSVVAFVITTALAGIAYRSAIKNLRRE